MRNINKKGSREIRLDRTKKETRGWMMLAEKSLNKIWNNKKDDEIWGKYL